MGGGTRRGSGPPSEPPRRSLCAASPLGLEGALQAPARAPGWEACSTDGPVPGGARVGAPGEGEAPEPPGSEGRLAALAPPASTLGLE